MKHFDVLRFALIVFLLANTFNVVFPPVGPSDLPNRIFSSLHPEAASLNQLPTTSESSGASFTSPTCGSGSKGSWSQLIASTAATSIVVVIDVDPGAADTFFVDVGTGAAASEVAKIKDLGFQARSLAAMPGAHWVMPFQILSGTRIAARCQAGAAVSVGVKITILE